MAWQNVRRQLLVVGYLSGHRPDLRHLVNHFSFFSFSVSSRISWLIFSVSRVRHTFLATEIKEKLEGEKNRMQEFVVYLRFFQSIPEIAARANCSECVPKRP